MNYGRILNFDTANGEGIRVTLFVSGCPHHCPECQNPMTWDEGYGEPFTQDVADGIIQKLKKPFISGLTISGGEPLAPSNLLWVTGLAKAVKQQTGKSIWLYTGYTWDYVKLTAANALKYVDVLVDGQFIAAQKDMRLKWRGSANQRVIDVPKSLNANRVVLWCD